jgi:hypothetical protein
MLAKIRLVQNLQFWAAGRIKGQIYCKCAQRRRSCFLGCKKTSPHYKYNQQQKKSSWTTSEQQPTSSRTDLPGQHPNNSQPAAEPIFLDNIRTTANHNQPQPPAKPGTKPAPSTETPNNTFTKIQH